ncbi:MAG: RCC1 domain-containing protein [Bdellovibrionota bacterium]
MQNHGSKSRRNFLKGALATAASSSLWSNVVQMFTTSKAIAQMGKPVAQWGMRMLPQNLYAFGYNAYGNLGIGNTTSKTSPTHVPGSWMFTWGYYKWGPLGQPYNGDFTYLTSPRAVTGYWSVAVAGHNFTLALRR